MQGCHNRGQKVEMGDKHSKKVMEGVDQVGLESRTLTSQQVSHVTWYLTTARQTAGTRLLCPVPSEPA